jgi:hypothetical protein
MRIPASNPARKPLGTRGCPRPLSNIPTKPASDMPKRQPIEYRRISHPQTAMSLGLTMNHENHQPHSHETCRPRLVIPAEAGIQLSRCWVSPPSIQPATAAF